MTESNFDKRPFPADVTFTLRVAANFDGEKVSKISFNMNLNPDHRILKIGEHLSSYPKLIAIFKDLDRVLNEIDIRTKLYNEMVTITPPDKPRFNPEYEENLKPTFGKIDSIDYRHESPGAANVTYARRYNGDIEPPSL